ncbi:hypothetical protein [Archaeoglobus profundus]|uniref:Uncharacterized protein n=1 Tax=Archaeoglobus profundus (strain DSM 5631 / JCM 9629 / NBRC 100127 / Av18) TaxID=572546 RepID=D2REY2_ARCPA|nr:hypothetical protein [Archaeoglobus profundus]ADB58676.1 hypothetical protein Arcpr_1630 [Archaeoglobus profundus DSM 5631]
MKVTIEIPPDIEEKLLKKCEEKGVSPSQFILALLEWYFLKRYQAKPLEISELVAYAKKIGSERVKYCKYSDGKFCMLESLDDVFEEKAPEPLNIYKCLFCPNYVDKRRERRRESLKIDEDMINVAKLAARFVVELYGDKLGYRPQLKVEDDKEDIEKVKKLIEDW